MQPLQIRCAFHPGEFLTNFCLHPSCLLPLCPTCIKIHTTQHIQMRLDPQYQHIHQLTNQIQQEVQHALTNYNQHYKNIVQVDARIQQFTNLIRQKVDNLKVQVIEVINSYFGVIQRQIDEKVRNLEGYTKLFTLKDQTKKTILYMKAVQRSLNDPQKAMRTVIKYKAEHIKDSLDAFHRQVQQFAAQMDNNFITFSIREDYKHSLQKHLDQFKKIQIHNISTFSDPIIDLSSKLKQVIHRQGDANVNKDLKKSIAHMLHRRSIPNQSMDFSRQDSIDGRRRSFSKGKGLTVMQNVSNLLNNTMTGSRIPKPVRLLSIEDCNFENVAIARGRITTTAARKMNR